MMRKNKLRMIAAAAAVLLITALVGNSIKSAAAQKVTVSDDEYNLYADDVPAEIGDDPYSKFTSNVTNTDDYSLVFDEDAAVENFTAALSKNNVTLNEDFICCFKTILYDWSGDDEKVVTSLKVESYFPLPTEAQEFPDECSFYKLSSGTLTPIYPMDLYEIDEVLYVKINYNSATDFNTIYGFVYADPDSFEEEDPDDFEDEDPDDGEDEDEDEDPTATPTPRPTVAPTAVPTSRPDETITSTPDPTATPTARPNNSGGTNTNSGGNGKKDSIPKTGDDFPLGGIVATSVVAAGLLAGAVIFMKKKK